MPTCCTGTCINYEETSFNRVNDISYNTYEGFVQDSWKVSPRLTLELGIRFTHFQPWIDRLGYGYSIFDYADYNSSCQPTQYCGFLWHKRDSSVPLGGFPTRALFYQPRIGGAYDLRQGKTVLRGGWGRYYYHSGQFTSGLDVAAGVQTYTLPNNINGQPLTLRSIPSLNIAAQALSPAAVDSTDSNQPYTDQYNVTLSQRTPGSGMLEVAYVGNRSRDLAISTGAGSDINAVPVGAMLASNNGGVDPNSLTANNFRPLLGFSDVNLATNKAWANYNALQITWIRTKGRYTINANYTFGKAMGIVNPALDTFNLNNDYGVQSTNRTHIFNFAYSVEMGSPIKGNKVEGGLLNGWQLSGLLQWESGPNLTAIQGENFGLNLNGALVPGTNYIISDTSLLGTPNIQLNPALTCNPAANLKANQYINASCFAMPTGIGENARSRAAGDLRAGLLQHRYGVVQELHHKGVKEAAVPVRRL